MADHPHPIEWRDGVPVSTRFGDPFYSLQNGLEETRYVFLDGNGLPDRLTPGFAVAELGVGTGLNLLALISMAEAAGIKGLRYTGFEAYPMDPATITRALEAFPEVAKDAALIMDALQSSSTFETDTISAQFVLGDARQTLPDWTGRADAWFLDGFAPARNPELWEHALLHEVARHTAPGGTAATYTAAGHVRRALTDAGFTVSRRPGYGRKRHMTVAKLA